MNITREQLERLKNLNYSRVNEILGLNPYNEWCKWGDTKFLMFIHDNGRYGFKTDGVWYSGENQPKELNTTSGYVKATTQEVEQALINEARRRGFLKRGNSFNSVFSDGAMKRYIEPFKCHSNINLYMSGDGYLRYKDGISTSDGGCSNPVIFKDGVWAEIIDEKAELRQEIKELEIKLKELRKKL